jgi:hypothetical protein
VLMVKFVRARRPNGLALQRTDRTAGFDFSLTSTKAVTLQ